MDTVDLIIQSSTSFYNDLKQDKNGRYRSWEHCYSNFCHARERDEVDYDYLSLQLAFYLASWGMYRGSSFLLQKDYKVHIPVVEELLQTKYKFAMNYLISPADYKRLALTRYISDVEKLVNMHSAG